jgi:hypothetical protein
LFVDSGRDMPIKIMTDTKSGAAIASPMVADIKQAIFDNKIDVLTVDPFVSSHGVSENDNTKIGIVAKVWSQIADETNCAVEWVRKSAHGQFQHTVDDGRGASALVAASWSARVLNVMREEESKGFGIEHRERYFREDKGSINLAPPPDRADWFRLDSIDIENGPADNPSDNMGVETACAASIIGDDHPFHLHLACDNCEVSDRTLRWHDLVARVWPESRSR